MNGKTIVGDEEIAKEFNKYFSEVGKKLAEVIPDNDIDPLHYVNPVSNSFTFKTISDKGFNLSQKVGGTDSKLGRSGGMRTEICFFNFGTLKQHSQRFGGTYKVILQCA